MWWLQRFCSRTSEPEAGCVLLRVRTALVPHPVVHEPARGRGEEVLVLVVPFEAEDRNERSRKLVGLREATTSSPRRLRFGLHIRVLLPRDPCFAEGCRTGASISLSGARQSRRASRTVVAPHPGFLPACLASGLLGGTWWCRHDYSPQKEAAASRRRPRQRTAAARAIAPGATPRRGCGRGRRRHGCGRWRP